MSLYVRRIIVSTNHFHSLSGNTKTFQVMDNMNEPRLLPKLPMASTGSRRWYGKSKQGMTQTETGKQAKFDQERESRYKKLKELIKEKHIKPKEGDEDTAPLRRPEV